MEVNIEIVRLSIKRNLFPVQRVATIKASRAAAIFLFFPLFCFFHENIVQFFWEIFFCKNEKKSLQSHLFEPPGRSTGNRIIFMDSLSPESCLNLTFLGLFKFWCDTI